MSTVVPGRLHPICPWRFPGEAHSREPADVSQPSTSRRPLSQFRITASAAALAAESLTPVVVRSLRSGRRGVPALMDLALPWFAALDFQSKCLRPQWVARQDSLALPASLTSPSLCLNLDTWYSDGSAGPEDVSAAGPEDVSAHSICISDVSSHSGDPDQGR